MRFLCSVPVHLYGSVFPLRFDLGVRVFVPSEPPTGFRIPDHESPKIPDDRPPANPEKFDRKDIMELEVDAELYCAGLFPGRFVS